MPHAPASGSHSHPYSSEQTWVTTSKSLNIKYSLLPFEGSHLAGKVVGGGAGVDRFPLQAVITESRVSTIDFWLSEFVLEFGNEWVNNNHHHDHGRGRRRWWWYSYSVCLQTVDQNRHNPYRDWRPPNHQPWGKSNLWFCSCSTEELDYRRQCRSFAVVIAFSDELDNQCLWLLCLVVCRLVCRWVWCRSILWLTNIFTPWDALTKL